MGKTRDLFKKIRDTKGTFHAKMSSIKDRNGTDLTEAEDIKKRWQEYTEERYKKEPIGEFPGLFLFYLVTFPQLECLIRELCDREVIHKLKPSFLFLSQISKLNG